MPRSKFDPRDPEHIRQVQKLLMARAERARTNKKDFFEFVMREQVTKRPLRCTPHQRVGLDFATDHSRCVRIWPAGASKTYLVVAETLWNLGKDPTTRGAVISKTQEIAAKILKVVREYIDYSPELKLVFPHLFPSTTDKWNAHQIVVDRPRGIPDPSLVALGIGGSIMGARLNWVVIDDILDFDNTGTEDARKKTIEFVESSVETRADPKASIVLNNTAWHPGDAVHHFAKKWATLRMTITGDVHVSDDPRRRGAYWDHDLLRPKYAEGQDYACRLVREGVDDANNDVPLFPERFLYAELEIPGEEPKPPAKTMEQAIEYARLDIENKRANMLPGEFNRAFMGIARDDSTAFCQQEWIDKCKKAARDAGFFTMVSEYKGPNPTFTGLDLAIGLGEQHDFTAFFTFEVLPDRRRRILDVEIGKWPGRTIVEKLIQKVKAYNSVARVENNGAQDFLRQQVLNMDASLPIKPHTTGRTKAHPEYGVPGGFVEMSNGSWLIPNDKQGKCHPHVQKWIDGCLYYSPSNHTDDSVMAWYFAREQAKAWGLLGPLPKKDPRGGGVGSGIMDR